MLTLKLISNIRAQVQKIIIFKDQWGGWPSKSVRKTHGCKVWRSIKVDWDKFIQFECFMVGMSPK